MIMFMLLGSRRHRRPTTKKEPAPPAPVTVRPLFKVLTNLAQVMVPAHGYVASRGLTHTTGLDLGPTLRTQLWQFLKQIARGCFWASMIAAGMLTYTAFTNKWREKGFPAIPITALIAADQAMGQRGPTSNVIPLSGGGNAQSYQGGQNRPNAPRQASLLDLDEYQG